MTEELKKEAERYIIGQRQHYTMGFDEVHRLIVGFADYVTKELQEENLKLEAKVRTLEIEQNYCLPNCSKIADLEKQIEKAKELLGDWLQIAHKNHARCYGFVKDTEQFLAEN